MTADRTMGGDAPTNGIMSSAAAAASRKPALRDSRANPASPIMMAARLATCRPLTESMCAVPDRRKASIQPSSMPAVSPMTTPCSTSFTRASGPRLRWALADARRRSNQPLTPPLPQKDRPAGPSTRKHHLDALMQQLLRLVEPGGGRTLRGPKDASDGEQSTLSEGPPRALVGGRGSPVGRGLRVGGRHFEQDLLAGSDATARPLRPACHPRDRLYDRRGALPAGVGADRPGDHDLGLHGLARSGRRAPPSSSDETLSVPRRKPAKKPHQHARKPEVTARPVSASGRSRETHVAGEDPAQRQGQAGDRRPGRARRRLPPARGPARAAMVVHRARPARRTNQADRARGRWSAPAAMRTQRPTSGRSCSSFAGPMPGTSPSWSTEVKGPCVSR